MPSPGLFFKQANTGGPANWTSYNGTKDKTPLVLGNPQDQSGVNRCYPIDATRSLIITVTDYGAGDALYAVIVSVNATGVVTQGTPVAVGTITNFAGVAGAAITDSSHAVIAYYDASIPGIEAVGISYTGVTINAVGSPVGFYSGTLLTATVMNIVALSSNAFAINYLINTPTNIMHVACGTVSGTVVTNPGSNDAAFTGYGFVSAQMRYIPLSAFDSTHTLVAWIDGNTSNIFYGLATISGSTPTPLPVSVIDLSAFDIGNFFMVTLRVIDSTHALMMWGFNTNAGVDMTQICMLTRSGTTLTAGTITALGVDASGNIPFVGGIALPNATQAMTFQQGSGGMYLQTLDIAGSTLTANTLVHKNSTNNRGGAVAEIGTNFIAMTYADSTNSSAPTLQILTPS